MWRACLFSPKKTRLSPLRTLIDYDREMALVAERRNPGTGEPEILGVSRLTKIHGAEAAEVAVVVSDQWHGRGLGKELMARLLIVAADDKVPALSANIMPENRDMLRVFEKLGFSLKHSMEDELVRAEFKL